MIKIGVFAALGLVVAGFVFVWLVTRIRYRIGSRQLKVVLFGLAVRRISLLSIEAISKRPGDGLTERWWSTMHPKHRILVIRRKRGLFRNFVITPRNRYVFKAELEKAISRAERHAGGPPSSPSEVEIEEPDAQPELSSSTEEAAR